MTESWGTLSLKRLDNKKLLIPCKNILADEPIVFSSKHDPQKSSLKTENTSKLIKCLKVEERDSDGVKTPELSYEKANKNNNCINISNLEARNNLKKALIITSLHHGFDEVQQNCLEILTDVYEFYIESLISSIKRIQNNLDLTKITVIEDSLRTKSNINSLKELIDFYYLNSDDKIIETNIDAQDMYSLNTDYKNDNSVNSFNLNSKNNAILNEKLFGAENSEEIDNIFQMIELKMIGIDFGSTCTDEEEQQQETSSNLFINHLRKCFIAFDDQRSCEYVLLPEVELDKINQRDLIEEKNELNWRNRLNNYINSSPHQYLKQIVDIPSKQKIENQKETFEVTNDEKETRRILNTRSKPVGNADINDVLKKRTMSSEMKYNSRLSDLLNEANRNISCFFKYAKFDENTNFSSKSQLFTIYFFLKDKTQPNPIKVNISKIAKISDLIGLACFKYTSENRIPLLEYTDVDQYSLKIIDDGEIDYEFPALEPTKNVGLFGFNQLALVENSQNIKQKEKSHAITKIKVLIFYFDGTAPDEMFFDDKEIQMRSIYKTLYDRKNKIPNIKYILEHKESGKSVQLDKCLSDFDKLEFYFYREHSRKCSEQSADVEEKLDLSKSLSFMADYLSKWRKIRFKIELSKEKLEIEDTSINIKNLTSVKSNIYTFSIENIVDCILIKELHHLNTCQIRLIVIDSSGRNMNNEGVYQYKYLDFEMNIENSNEFRKKLLKLISFSKSSFLIDYYDNYDRNNIIKWSRKTHNSY